MNQRIGTPSDERSNMYEALRTGSRYIGEVSDSQIRAAESIPRKIGFHTVGEMLIVVTGDEYGDAGEWSCEGF